MKRDTKLLGDNSVSEFAENLLKQLGELKESQEERKNSKSDLEELKENLSEKVTILDKQISELTKEKN